MCNDIKKHYFELASGSEDLRRKMCHHYLGFAYKLACRVSQEKVNSLIDEVYSYMPNHTIYQKLIYKLIVKYRLPNFLRKIIGTIYAKWSS